MPRDTPPTDDTTRPDPEVVALKARVLADLDLELARTGHRGHVERLAALRRAGRVNDQTQFENLEREARL